MTATLPSNRAKLAVDVNMILLMGDDAIINQLIILSKGLKKTCLQGVEGALVKPKPVAEKTDNRAMAILNIRQGRLKIAGVRAQQQLKRCRVEKAHPGMANPRAGRSGGI